MISLQVLAKNRLFVLLHHRISIRKVSAILLSETDLESNFSISRYSIYQPMQFGAHRQEFDYPRAILRPIHFTMDPEIRRRSSTDRLQSTWPASIAVGSNYRNGDEQRTQTDFGYRSVSGQTKTRSLGYASGFPNPFQIWFLRFFLGHTISNFKEICTRWSAYVQRAKNGKPEPVQHYVVKADITGCFDSINQQVLWDILNESLLKDAPGHYSLHGHDMIRSSATHASRKHRYAVRTLAKYESLARHYTNLEKSGGAGFKAKSGTLVVPKGGPILKSKQEVIALLRQLIFRRILTFGGDRRKYLQSVGISQGSSLSVLLCNLYLAALEKKHLDSLIMESEDILVSLSALSRHKNR